MSNEKRVYSEKVDISEENIKEFYNKRVKDFLAGKKSSNTTVLLGDNNPEYAEKWNDFEKKKILPSLSLDKNKKVLDIGCGVGRWAESVVPLCGEYVGVDFSEEMVKVTTKRFEKNNNTLFKRAAFIELFDDIEITGKKYDAVIIAGVSMLINDEVLKICYEKLPFLLNSGAIVYIEESVGVGKRLTLNGVWSENLNTTYEAIYRTREEYRSLLAPMLAKANVLADDYFNVLDKKEFTDTSHWYTILEMK